MLNEIPVGEDAKGKGKDYTWLFLAVACFLILPLAFVQYVPMVDLPGHLARLYILQTWHQVPQFQAIYEINHRPIPNLALEMVILPLAHVMSLWHATRVCVALTMALFAFGCWTLSRTVYGRITPLAVLALFTLYNSTFFYGFVAFHMSVGLALLTISLWYRWRSGWTAVRVASLVALGVLLYLCHLGGYVYLSVAVGWLTLRAWRRERRISMASLIGLLPLIPPVFIYLSLGKGRGAASFISFGTLSYKLQHAAVLLVGYDMYLDAAVAFLLVLAAGAAYRYGKFRFHPEIGSLGVVFAILFLLIPTQLLTGMDADARMMVGAGVFLLMGFTCDIAPAKGKLIYAVALLALLTRAGYCGWVWKEQSDLIAGQVAFLDEIPEGSRVYPVLHFPDNLKANKFVRIVTHVPDLATVERDAIVPTTFTVAGQHSVVERIPLWCQNRVDPAHQKNIDWDRVAREYDVVWQYGQDPAVRAILDQRFHLIGEYGDARLYRVAVRPES